MASGASGDRRLGPSRRGMTVLGKIPSPAVPKPINLPSQKLESKGLEPNVEIVPRGTFTWGSRVGPTSNKSGAPNIASSPPTSGVWADVAKGKTVTVSGGDAGMQPSSPGSTRPSSAPTAGRSWDSIVKSQFHGDSAADNADPIESSTLGSQRTIGVLPHKNNLGSLDRPISADGVSFDKDRHSAPLHGGVIYHGTAVPGPDIAVFPRSADSKDPYMQQVMPSARAHDPRVGVGIYPRPPHHDGLYPSGISHYNNLKDRDMVVVTMVGNTGYYGSYSPQVGQPEYFMQPQVYGSYPPHAQHPEHFKRQSHVNRGAWSHNLSKGHGRDGDISLSNAKALNETEMDVRRQGDGWFGSGPVYDAEQNHRISKVSGRDKLHNGEWGDSGHHMAPVYDGISAMPSAERKIVLLTKTSRIDEQNIMEKAKTLDTGRTGIERNVEKPDEVQNKSNENTNFKLEVKDVGKFVENVEGKRKDRFVTNNSTKAFGQMDEQAAAASVIVGCNKDELQVGAGLSKSSWATDSRYDVECESSTYELSAPLEEIQRVAETNKCANNRSMSESGSNDAEYDIDSRKITVAAGTAMLVGEDHQAANKDTSKTMMADPTLKDEHKARSRLHQKTGKEWRPKSPATDSHSSHCSTSSKLNEQAPSGGISEMQEGHLSAKTEATLDAQSDKERLDTVPAKTEHHTGRKHHKEFLATVTNAAINPDTNVEDSKSLSIASVVLKDDSKSKMKLKGEREWRPKSPAVESVSSFLSSKIDLTHVSDVELTNSEKKKIGEHESSDLYDYEGQRAKLKENATQRAMQRRREEEEREKEQKAKALAKLKELERRTATHNTTVETSEHDSVVVNDNAVNDDGAKGKHKRKPRSSKHAAKDSSHEVHDSEEGLTDKNLVNPHILPASKIGAKSRMEKMEYFDNVTGPFTALGKRINESDENVKTLQFTASTQKSQGQEFEQVHDLQDRSTHDKAQLKNKKNENAKLGRSRQERRYLTEEHSSKETTREAIKKGSYHAPDENEDDKEIAFSVHGDIHGRAQSIRPTSTHQYSRESGHYRQKQMVESDPNMREGHLDNLLVPDRESTYQHLRQERMGKRVMPSSNERVVSPEAKQTKGLDARYSSEKSGRLHASWKQKNSSKDCHADGEHFIGNNLKQTESHSEGSSETKKSQRARNGRKQSFKSNQQVSVLSEPIELYHVEENKQEVPVLIPSSSNIEDVKGNENIKSGRLQNSWRQKNNNTHSTSTLSSVGETAAQAEYQLENGNEINSNTRNNLKQSPKVSSAAPVWQKNRTMRPNDTGQTKSQHALEDGLAGQQGRQSMITSKQIWDGKHHHETDNHVQKNSPQWHAESTFSETNMQGHKHAGIASNSDNQLHPNQRRHGSQRPSEPTAYLETSTQGHKQSGMVSNNRSRAKFESHKSNRQYQPTSQVFKPSNEQVESKAERTNDSENRHGQGRDKVAKQAQLSGCSTSADFERNDPGPVIKTEISY